MVSVAGLATIRERPETARDLLEDEAGMFHVIVSPELFESDQVLWRTEPLLLVEG